jgi:hypothetical protein
MTKEQEHELKMAFARQLLNGAAVANPNRKDRRGKRGGRMSAYRSLKAQESLGLGCHSTQVKERRRLTEKLGLSGIEHRDDGTVYYTDEKQRDKFARYLGLENMTGSLGG